jgi:23S rRNA (guanosine2251-2'-O)-methyltransferase
MNNKDTIIYGFHSVEEALSSGKSIEKILFRKGLKNESFHDLFKVIREEGIPYQFVPSQKLDRITGKNHQGVIAFIAPIEFQKIEDILPMLYEQGETPFFLILDKITDVRNFGAIARTAECAGVHAILMPIKNSAKINQDAVKTSAGALMKIPVCRSSSLTDSAKYLKDSGVQVVSVTEKSDKPYHSLDYSKPTALVLGAEDIGIEEKLLQISNFTAQIPLKGEIESLNVSVAAGILMFEVVKQRNG